MNVEEIEDIKRTAVRLQTLDLSARFEQALEKLPEGKAELFTVNFMDGKKPLRLIIKGFLTTNGVSSKASEWGGMKHIIGLDLSDKTMDFMNGLHDQMMNVKGLEGSEWDIRDIFFNGKWFPQLKTDPTNKKFRCRTMPNITPGKSHDDICPGIPVTVFANPGAWMSVSEDSKKAGVFFQINKVIFDVGEGDKDEEDVVVVTGAKAKSRKRSTADS